MRSHPRDQRRGAVAVEFALTAPLLFLLVFAGIEFSRANMLIHTATIAATEGARRGIVAGATAGECYQAAQAELVTVGVNDASILVQPAQITDDTQLVTVGVRVPLGVSNGYVTPRFFLGRDVVRVVSITREAQDSVGSAARAQQLNSQAANDLNSGGGQAGGLDAEQN